jgi:hypothetical protein
MGSPDKNLVFISLDADNAGNRIGRAVLADDPDEMSRISERISLGNKLVERWARERNGRCLSSGGDQGVYSIDKQYLHELEQLRKDYHFITQLTVSIGIGEHLSESGQALLVAKLLGKDRIVFFDKETKKKIQQIKKAAKKGRYKSMEEQKIAEANFKKNELIKAESDGDLCPYCETSDGVDPDHCKFCHDVETQEGEETCPYCKGSQNDPSLGPKEPEIADEDCAFCKEQDVKRIGATKEACPYCGNEPAASLVSPDSNDETAIPGSEEEQEQYDRMGMHPPEIGKPSLEDHAPIGQNAPMDTVPKGDPDPNQRLDDQRDVEVIAGNATGPDAIDAANNNLQATSENAVSENNTIIDPEDNHSKDALTNIAEQIRTEGTPIAGQRDRIGDENIPSGTAMEGNISRPDGYSQDVPSDMGEEGPNPLSDNSNSEDNENPDFGILLEEGLDKHAQSIQKEKAVQMVSQALVEFKSCKDILEQNKMQMPQLYQGCISILKAMIELAGVLNLGGSDQPTELGQEQAALVEEATPEENTYQDPFPTHPDHGGEPKPEHHKSASQTNADGTGSPSGGAVGQSIGKLPTSATTKHIARTVIPENGITSKGQQKITDKSGTTRFIDLKQGRVMGEAGVPVKPPKRG